ncbi:surface antigen-domain-containing protein [Sporodiniella umbellata]|nr:surface antigen-domain-containing protein [Sporodiniella umbellata]
MSNNPFSDVPPEAPLRVDSLRVLGTTGTRHSFLNGLTSHVFHAKTAQEVLDNVEQVLEQMQKHDVFEEIKVYLNTHPNKPDTVNITVQLKEKDKGVLVTKVNVGDNQAELTGGLGIRNLFGGGESVSTNFAFGNRTKAAVESVLETPFFSNAHFKAGIFGNWAIRDHSQINAFKEASKSLGLRLRGWSKFGEHQIAYTVSDKDITALQSASYTVRSNSASHVKHSIHHKFVRDLRNDPLLPTEGHYVGLFQEIAGLGSKGDVSYIKHELNASLHQPLSQSLTFSTSVRAGLLSHVTKNVNITDRFYLGGPLSVRGFRMGGIGERDGNDAVGGEAYWAAGASLIGSIPGMKHLPIKAHAFANAGSIVTKATRNTIHDLTQEPRASAGFGFILHHSIARIEANYCIPLRYSASDLPQPKFQFGFGLNFL